MLIIHEKDEIVLYVCMETSSWNIFRRKAKCETVCIVKYYDVEAVLVVRNILANKEDAREAGSTPGSRRLPGGRGMAI